jgi:hypothetical protein
MNYWIFVESLTNWKVDAENNFTHLGVDVNKYIKRNPEKGDLIFSYISKEKKISDLREITNNSLFETPQSFKYDKAFPMSVSTRLIKVLSEEDWISYYKFNNELEIFKDKTRPQLVLLNAPVKITKNDSNFLLNLMKIDI